MRQRPISKRLQRFLDNFGTHLCPIELCPKTVAMPWRDLRFNNSKIEIRHFTWAEWRQGAASRMGRHDYQPKIMRDLENYRKS